MFREKNPGPDLCTCLESINHAARNESPLENVLDHVGFLCHCTRIENEQHISPGHHSADLCLGMGSNGQLVLPSLEEGTAFYLSYTKSYTNSLS